MLITNLEFTAPIKVINESNNYDHWSKKLKRKQSNKEEMLVELHNVLHNNQIQLPCVVHFIRIGPKKLDSDDNLNISFKACRDAVASKLGVDDGDTSKIRFVYSQEPCRVRKYSIRVEIKSL